MKKVSITTLTGAVLVTLLLALPVVARERTALNGTWILQADKSSFGGQPAVQSGTVTIDERQGNITVSRSFTYQGADGETLFYKDMTDSRNNATIHTGTDLKSKARWDHDVLKVTTTRASTTTVETYRLGADGGMTAEVAGPQGAQMTLVFHRR